MKNKLSIILTVSILIIIAILYRESTVLVQSSGSTIQLQSTYSPISFKLNRKPLFPSKLEAVTSNGTILNVKKSDDDSVFMMFLAEDDHSLSNQEYDITLKYFGQAIGGLYVIGPPALVSTGTINNEIEISTNYPLAQYLPYRSQTLTVEYVSPKELRLKSFTSEKSAIKEIEMYANQLGIDLKDHTFTYIPTN